MSVSVIVPFRSGAERDRNWEFLRRRYERLYPEWEIVTSDCEGMWCKGAAVNRAVEKSSGEILVIADADVMISPQALTTAVLFLPQSAWVVPHDQVWRMNEDATNRLLNGGMGDQPFPLREADWGYFPRPAIAGGGMFVLWRKDFLEMDERFIEWGGEDISYGRALDTLIGRHRNLPSVMWHLWHEPMPTRESRRTFLESSEELAHRYQAALGNPEAMQELIDESLQPA